MDKTEHLLTILSEECAEIIKEVSKSLRFGLDDHEPNKQESNRERITKEYADLVAVFEMLNEQGIIKKPMLYDIEEKKRRVAKFMLLAKSLGTIND